MDESLRPPPSLSAREGAGTRTRDCTPKAMSAMAAKIKKEPRKGTAKKSLPHLLDSGPRKPPAMPPASTSEMAFALKSGAATSAAANRYCSPKAV